MCYKRKRFTKKHLKSDFGIELMRRILIKEAYLAQTSAHKPLKGLLLLHCKLI